MIIVRVGDNTWLKLEIQGKEVEKWSEKMHKTVDEGPDDAKQGVREIIEGTI